MTTTPATLMVVDDDLEIRELLADYLGRHGYQVRTADGADYPMTPGRLYFVGGGVAYEIRLLLRTRGGGSVFIQPFYLPPQVLAEIGQLGLFFWGKGNRAA